MPSAGRTIQRRKRSRRFAPLPARASERRCAGPRRPLGSGSPASGSPPATRMRSQNDASASRSAPPAPRGSPRDRRAPSSRWNAAPSEPAARWTRRAPTRSFARSSPRKTRCLKPASAPASASGRRRREPGAGRCGRGARRASCGSPSRCRRRARGDERDELAVVARSVPMHELDGIVRATRAQVVPRADDVEGGLHGGVARVALLASARGLRQSGVSSSSSRGAAGPCRASSRRVLALGLRRRERDLRELEPAILDARTLAPRTYPAKASLGRRQ